MTESNSPTISLRPVSTDDQELLLAIYASTRADELALVSWWTDEQKAGFVKLQSDAQHAHYRTTFPQAEYSVIIVNDRPVGRLYTAELDEELRVLDLTLLPKSRNSGVGSFLLNRLLEQSRGMGKSLTIYIESFSPSLQLLERLGFKKAGENGLYFLMQHAAGTEAQPREIVLREI